MSAFCTIPISNEKDQSETKEKKNSKKISRSIIFYSPDYNYTIETFRSKSVKKPS